MQRIYRIHFVGIGGIGVSSLAYWFQSQKWAVSGSDAAPSLITRNLRKDGFKVKIGHKKANLGPGIDLVIYSNAIKPDNPEIREAERLKLPVLSYPQAVGELTKDYLTFGVAGAHGKSTTTALLALTLIKAGWDPTVIVGTKLKEFGGRNFRLGRSGYLVLEADEFKGAFWNYFPFGAIITNIDREHLDFYKNLGNVRKSFLRYAGNVAPSGIIVANRDDVKLRALKPALEQVAKRGGVRLKWYSAVRSPIAARIKRNLSISGEHNLSNAMSVYVLARFLGVPERTIFAAFKVYRGAWRRMEFKGMSHLAGAKVFVYDDYAHHPTEIKATLQAFREKHPQAKVLCVFQPHQARRLQLLFNGFIHAFGDADKLILLPSYKVAGRDSAVKKYTSESLARKIKGAVYLTNPLEVRAAVVETIRSGLKPPGGWVIVMMGAGTIAEYTKHVLKL
jgi:UDP-N-acetylmuramate--alanine ligase